MSDRLIHADDRGRIKLDGLEPGRWYRPAIDSHGFVTLEPMYVVPLSTVPKSDVPGQTFGKTAPGAIEKARQLLNAPPSFDLLISKLYERLKLTTEWNDDHEVVILPAIDRDAYLIRWRNRDDRTRIADFEVTGPTLKRMSRDQTEFDIWFRRIVTGLIQALPVHEARREEP